MRKNSLLKVATFALCGVLAIGSVTASAKVKVKNDANNGDWSAKKVTILDTSEADLMVRVGDIDCLNEKCEDIINAYNPFKKGSEFSHCWFWKADEKDPEGTDSIYVGTKASKNKKIVDGYADDFRAWQEADKNDEYYKAGAFTKGALKVTLNYKDELKEITVKSAVLQIGIDDFQAQNWNSKFSVKINGKKADFLSDIINKQNQTGPVSSVITVKIPQKFIKYVKKGKLTITIDETTGMGDGYAVDFVKLLVNPKNEMVSKGVELKSVKAEDGVLVVNYAKSKDKGTTGYEIRYSTKSSMAGAESVFVEDIESTSEKIYDLKAGKKYYVQVRSYVEDAGSKDFSEWSVIKNVKLK